MSLTEKGKKIMEAMTKNKGNIKGEACLTN